MCLKIYGITENCLEYYNTECCLFFTENLRTESKSYLKSHLKYTYLNMNHDYFISKTRNQLCIFFFHQKHCFCKACLKPQGGKPISTLYFVTLTSLSFSRTHDFWPEEKMQGPVPSEHIKGDYKKTYHMIAISFL